METLQREEFLVHHGILGQKWGIRRYQNKDGTLTEAGRKRYLKSDGSLNEEGLRTFKNQYDKTKKVWDQYDKERDDWVKRGYQGLYVSKATAKKSSRETLKLKNLVRLYGDPDHKMRDLMAEYDKKCNDYNESHKKDRDDFYSSIYGMDDEVHVLDMCSGSFDDFVSQLKKDEDKCIKKYGETSYYSDYKKTGNLQGIYEWGKNINSFWDEMNSKKSELSAIKMREFGLDPDSENEIRSWIDELIFS